MKIIGSMPISGVTGKYNENTKNNAVRRSGEMGSDKVELSDSAKVFAAAMKAVKDAPDVRASLVEDIKNRVDNGSYNVDSSSIADAMMRRISF